MLLGPTASGKTALAVRLAHYLNTEIISADSRQVYRGMDIGTGKDLKEYEFENSKIPYHLIDIVNAGENYHLHAFMNDFFEVFQSLNQTQKIPILCGGTGLYIESVLKGLEYVSIPINETLRADLMQKSPDEVFSIFEKFEQNDFKALADTSTLKRTIRAIEIMTFLKENKKPEIQFPTINPIILGIAPDRETRRLRIENRLKLRLKNGLIEEVERLLNQGISAEKLIFYGLEYKFVVQYLQNEIKLQELEEKLTIAIQQFARRQMTWFRKMEKDGFEINWINGNLSLNEQQEEAIKILKTKNLNQTPK